MNRRECCIGLAAGAALSQVARASAAPEPAPLRSLFRTRDGRFAAIGRFDEFGRADYLFDYAHNRCGRLVQAGSDVWTANSQFSGIGKSTGTLTRSAHHIDWLGEEYARRPIERRAFTAANQDVTLHAEIARCSDTAARRAILLVYGSGPAPKETLDFWAFHFLSRGWAVITYDKRGSGESSGDWRQSGFEALAQDAALVVERARAEPELDKLKIGAWGGSQAGWILPQLGARGLLDFIIMHSGPATTPRQQTLDQVEARLRLAHATEGEIDAARIYYDLDLNVSCGRAPWSEIQAAYESLAAAKPTWLTGPPSPEGAPERTLIRLVADFDPAAYWARNRAPVLSIYGSKDVIVPVETNAALLQRLIPPSVRHSSVTLAGANHFGMVADTGAIEEYSSRTEIHPQYFPTIDDWLGLPS